MSTSGQGRGKESTEEGEGDKVVGAPKEQFDVRVFEESPPEDAPENEFQHSNWFIDRKWRMVIDPPPGRKSGKTKAFVQDQRTSGQKNSWERR